MLIKYRYALDSVNKIVDVTQLQRQELKSEKVFKCLGCGKILIPVLGQKRKKHFRHKVDLDCSPETYLHKLAKVRFYEVYSKCLEQKEPFFITINQEPKCTHFKTEFLFSCELDDRLKTFDITKYFRKIYLEEKEDSFIPDLLLVSQTGDRLFVEIAVTHFSSQKKIDSGYRLIEINIGSENDIEIINSKDLFQSEKVNFINFKTNIAKDFCRGKCYQNFKPYSYCQVKYDYFVVFKNGKSAILSINLDEINRLHKNQKLNYGELVFFCNSNMTRSETYIKLIVESFINDRGVKNCFLCRYHGESLYSDKPIFCKFLKKDCGSNEAANCEYYRPDTKAFPSLDFKDI